jgi:transposase
VHSIAWRALPVEFGNWNSIWKRFWRLSRSGVFEAFLQLLAETSKTAHVVQFFDSTVVRAHVSAAGAKATVLRVKRRFSGMHRDASIGIGDTSRCHPSHTTGHTGPYHGGSAD